MKLTLGFSPCPNDTFIFDALVNKKIDTGGLDFNYVMEDVETLNRWAAEGRLDITKLSYSAFLHTAQLYALLHSGSALGKGVGPLLVSRQPKPDWEAPEWQKKARIAIPGKNTTANLLLSLAFPDMRNKEELVFSEIEQAVLSGEFDAGLIIHEGRFTYAAKGLVKLADLGDWWEQTMNAAIPLGGIVIKRSLGKDVAERADALIKESIEYAWKNYPVLAPFVTANAQEMEEEVMRRHIDLYVNEYSLDLGPGGRKAVLGLFRAAKEAGIIGEDMSSSIFY